jgi:hypothetical protein
MDMSFDADKVYALLPAIHRLRDAQSGGALRALVEILAQEAQVVERDIDQIYDNWFIETCEEWVVPYLGDLLGVRGLHPVSPQTFSQRAWVANTLGYRRRKGTATMLEQLARDVTGWPARAVELFQRLATSQHCNHVRLDAPATASLANANALELVDTAFDTLAHTGEVRSIAARRGRYNIPNIGLFVWRLASYPVGRAGTKAGDLPADFGTARAIADPADGRYTFSPLGRDGALFNVPVSEDTITHLAEERNVPGMLRRRALHDELEALRQALVDGAVPPEPVHLAPGASIVRVLWRKGGAGALEEIPRERIVICALADPPPPAAPPADWPRPSAKKKYRRTADGTEVERDIDVAIDPLSGRLAFPAGVVPQDVAVCYACGFPGDVGGGPYDRGESIDTIFRDPGVWQVGVSRTRTAVGGESIFTRLKDAVTAWNALPAGRVGVIVLMDSTTEHDLAGDPVPPIRIQEKSKLIIVGADWPVEPVPGSPGATQRLAGHFDATQVRPHFRGSLQVAGAAPAGSKDPGSIIVNGLWLEGGIEVMAAASDGSGAAISGNLGALTIAHSTLVPAAGGVAVAGDNKRLAITVTRSITGPISVVGDLPHVALVQSVVDAGNAVAVGAPGQAITVTGTSVFGSIACRTVEASSSLLLGALVASRRQVGCVRFCWLTEGSRTPQRFQCQPDLALARASEAKGSPLTAEEAAAIRGRLLPQFTSVTHGHHAYTQLAATCAAEIRTGADDGSEIGVWGFLLAPQREANLVASLDEYLRFGLEAGLLYVT